MKILLLLVPYGSIIIRIKIPKKMTVLGSKVLFIYLQPQGKGELHKSGAAQQVSVRIPWIRWPLKAFPGRPFLRCL